jgi:hypothetical protein
MVAIAPLVDLNLPKAKARKFPPFQPHEAVAQSEKEALEARAKGREAAVKVSAKIAAKLHPTKPAAAH